MTLIVSDTSPLNLLIQLRVVEVLPALFQCVLIPPEVAGEMRHLKAPQLVRDFVAAPPTWLRIQSATVPRSFPELDPGESAAINLAIELRATLMIDEADGRAIAIASGLKIIGVVGILERAANQGIIPDLKRLHDQIRLMPFHISDVILADSLARHLASRRT